MPHGFHNGEKVKLALRSLPPPEPLERPPWNKAFFKSRTLTQPKEDIPNRKIRDVELETAIFKSGGNPELADSFSLNQTLDLEIFAEDSIDALRVPIKEWHHVDHVSERTVYTKSLAAHGALSLAKRSKGFTIKNSYSSSTSTRNIRKDPETFQRW